MTVPTSRAAVPTFETLDQRGTGDSMFAATGVGLARGMSMIDALRLGMAAGALNATRRGLGSGTRDEIERLAAHVRSRRRALRFESQVRCSGAVKTAGPVARTVVGSWPDGIRPTTRPRTADRDRHAQRALVVVGGRVEVHQALLVQLHHGDRGEGLGDRPDPKHCVLVHRLFGGTPSRRRRGRGTTRATRHGRR